METIENRIEAPLDNLWIEISSMTLARTFTIYFNFSYISWELFLFCLLCLYEGFLNLLLQ